MLVSPESRTLVAHLGWVDHSSLWVYDVQSDTVRLAQVGDARYLTLHESRDAGRFVVMHHTDGKQVRLTVHGFDDPVTPLCSLELSAKESRLNGDAAALETAPRYYIAYYDAGDDKDYHPLSLDPRRAEL